MNYLNNIWLKISSGRGLAAACVIIAILLGEAGVTITDDKVLMLVTAAISLLPGRTPSATK